MDRLTGQGATPVCEVLRPAGAGPFPTVLLLHGCGGLQPLQRRYAEACVAAGAAAVLVDSFGPRRISRAAAHLTVCTGLRLRGAERAGDLFQALDWLRAQPWADAERLSAAGWSHGGWTVMDALALAANDPARSVLAQRLKAVVLIYPYCGPPSLTRRRGWGGLSPQVTALIGGRDAVVGQRDPLRALDRLTQDGVSVDTRLFPEATHAFDDDDASDPRTRYQPDLTRQAMALVVEAVLAAR